jgi:hypothetical protein
MDDFFKLHPTEHMLQWLSDEPYNAIREQIESTLQRQVPGSRLVEFGVTSDPQWLNGARPGGDDPDKLILVRTGVAFEFNLVVHEPSGQAHQLQGTYSWVGVHLDDPGNAQQRVWLDLGATLETHGSEGELMGRMYFDADESA